MPPVLVRDFDWHDAARNRPVPVRLYWPTRDTPVPLLVFSHGLFGSRAGYSYIGRYMASRGVASLHLQHVGSDRNLWGGNVVARFFRVMNAAGEEEALARVHDLRFALDQMLADAEFGPRLDPQAIVGGGHSYGANTMMLAAGATVVRGGERLALRDERLRGLLLISAPPFYGEADLTAVLRTVALPSLHITNDEDVINVPGYHSPVTDRLAVFEAMGGADKALVVFKAGGHSIFTDRTWPGGTALNQRIKRATQELAGTFVDSLLRHGRLVDVAVEPWRERHGDDLARLELRAG